MRRRLTTLVGLGAVLSASILWLIAAPVVSAGDPCYHGFEIPKASTAAATTIALEPCSFTPTLTNVAVGSTVTFKNTSDFTHLITGANQAWGSRDAELAPGAAVTYSFTTAGLYPYSCALHRGMSGVVVVGDLAAIGAASGASTSGTTTGSTTTSGTQTAATTPAAASTDPLPVALAAVLAGIVIGGLGSWLLSRARTARASSTVPRAA